MKFIELQDAPVSYAAAANKNVRVNSSETEVEFGGAYLEYGLAAAIGAAGRLGRMYWATDTKILYRDDGVDWVEILRGEAVSRLASLSEKAHASLTGVSADQHHAQAHTLASHTGIGVIDLVYPVGSIYVSVVATNPGTLFGVGTWVAFGAGKVPVGLNAAETEFDTVEETGGAKTVSIPHTHTGPSHQHDLSIVMDGYVSLGAYYWSDKAAQELAGTGATGGMSANDPHSNLQPYIVVYMWKRTA